MAISSAKPDHDHDRGRTVTPVVPAATLAFTGLVLALAAPAGAKPAYKKQVENFYRDEAPAAVLRCTLCHLTDAQVEAQGDAVDPDLEKPWNAFGLALKAHGAAAKEETGRRPAILDRIRALSAGDADGDGAANEIELLAGTWPGDAASTPTEAQGTAAEDLLARLLRRYPWRPFSPVRRPPVPEVGEPAWVRNPIDAFIAARRDERGLPPRPEATREVWLRRVYLDLIGLPPTPRERREFLDDRSPGAFENVADRLLDSPHYGERWGRHWMDIWRYADRDLQQLKGAPEIPPHMWRWRDWIIQSLNDDVGYDRMVQEMLAADELAPDDPDVLRATGYLARNKAKSRDIWMHSTVDHTLQAFAGLAVQCARCHDHPVDPIEQVEYYRLRAFFEPLAIRVDPFPPAKDAKEAGFARAFDANRNARTFLYVRGNELKPDKENPVPPGVPALLDGPAPPRIEAVSPPSGSDRKPSTGRRGALARWLTAREHPTAARVAANHIWGRHFGRALAPSVNDFGAGGEPPSHPALLDWLAADLIAHGWKMKRLHRLIVTSATYRMASTPPTTTAAVAVDAAEQVQAPSRPPAAASGPQAVDPDNRFLWRFPPRRLEAEAVRDAILAVSGRLDRAVGGPTIELERAPRERRRSLYFRHGPNTQMTFLATFDGAVVEECYQRRPSVQPAQALALLNSRLALQSSRHLARELTREAGDDVAAFIDLAFAAVLSRAATGDEYRYCAGHLQEVAGLLAAEGSSSRSGVAKNLADLDRPAADPALRARESLVQILFNHHDFLTLQ